MKQGDVRRRWSAGGDGMQTGAGCACAEGTGWSATTGPLRGGSDVPGEVQTLMRMPPPPPPPGLMRAQAHSRGDRAKQGDRQRLRLSFLVGVTIVKH